MASRPSASVYRRRRLVALLALIVVIALVWWAIAALVGGGNGQAAPTTATTGASTPAGPATTAPAETTAEATPTAPVTTDPAAASTGDPLIGCTGTEVLVEATTDAPNYAPDALPQLSMRVTNIGATPCAIDVGTVSQQYTITSGGAVVWASTHCQQAPSNEVVRLDAGQQLSAPPIPWVREHSAPETCAAIRPPAAADGTAYELTVMIGGIPSAPVGFVLD